MARVARVEVFDPTEVSVFHCVNRCVRRCFLCGDDPRGGRATDVGAVAPLATLPPRPGGAAGRAIAAAARGGASILLAISTLYCALHAQ